MLPDNSTETPKQMEARRGYLSEAFHSFNQPLTALHCGLELSLLKERTGEEYRQRIEDAVANAGTVLQLSKAVRELVEATDPGEELRKIELEPVITSLAEQLSMVADAAAVALTADYPKNIVVFADGSKLARHVGNLASLVIRKLAPGGSFQLKARSDADDVVIEIASKGKQRDEVGEALESKLDAIRIDAACSYVWTLGGDFTKLRSGFTIRLRALK